MLRNYQVATQLVDSCVVLSKHAKILLQMKDCCTYLSIELVGWLLDGWMDGWGGSGRMVRLV
jgi:hypothetical protein